MKRIGSAQYTVIDVGDGMDANHIWVLTASNSFPTNTIRTISTGKQTVVLNIVTWPDGKRPAKGDIAQIQVLDTTTNKPAFFIGTITSEVTNTSTTLSLKVIGHIESGANGANGKNGTNGRDGVNGRDGADGKGIRNIINFYHPSTSGTSTPFRWRQGSLLADRDPDSLPETHWNQRSGGNGRTEILNITSPPNTKIKKMVRITGNTTGNKDRGTDKNVVAQKRYVLGCWARKNGTADTTLLMRIWGVTDQEGPSNRYKATYSITHTDWRWYEHTFIANVTQSCGVQYGQTGGGSIDVAGFEFREATTTPEWRTYPVVATDAKRFVWTYQETEYSDGTFSTTNPVLTTSLGLKGIDGKGVRSATNYYLISNSLTGVTTNSQGWSTTPRAPTLSQKYLWVYTKYVYTDNTESVSGPYIAGAYGDKGAPGADGRIYYTWIRYADNAQGANMSADPNGKRYIGFAWNKETQTPSNVASDYKWSPMFGNAQIGGRNLIMWADIVRSSNAVTDWTRTEDHIVLTVPTSATTWGHGVKLQYNASRRIVAYRGETIMVSFDIKANRNFSWNVDVNNSYISNNVEYTGTGNDFDETPKRATSPKSLQAGRWHRAWFSYTAKNDTTYEELFDKNSIFGFLPQSSTYKGEIRRIMVEIADTPSAYVPPVEQYQEWIAAKLDLSEREKIDELERVARSLERENEDLLRRFDAMEKEWQKRLNDLNNYITSTKSDILAANDSMDRRLVKDYKEYVDGKVQWDFLNNKMEFSEEGIRLGDRGSNAFMHIGPKSISIFNGSSQPAMVVSDGFIEIGSGIFTQNNRVGHYIEERLSDRGDDEHINVIRYIK